MTKLTKKLFALLLVLAMCASLVACGGGSKDEGGSSDGGSDDMTLNVAWIGPVTGSASRSGEELYNGLEMQLEKIDYKVGDYTIKVHKVDSESNAEKAALAYEKCILDNDIDVGINTWHSWVSASCIEVAAKYEIPQFLTFGASQDVKDKVNEDFDYYKYWAGKTWPQPIYLVQGYVDCIQQAIDAGTFAPASKTLAIYGVDEDWGRTFAGAAKDGFENNGWSTAVEEYFQLGTTDYYAVLNKMKDAGCTLCVGTMSDVNSATSFIKQAGEIGLQALIVCDGLGWLSEWYELTGEASNYVLDMIPQYTSDTAKKFVEDYKAKYGYEPGPSTAGLAYDCSGFFVKILNTTLDTYGDLSKENIMKCWEEKAMTGELTYTMADDDAIMMPSWDYSSKDMYPDPIVDEDHYCFPVVQYFDGVGIPVYPASMASQELSVPDTWK